MYETKQYILLFFIYGLAFFSMGISALQQNIHRNSNFPLLKSIKYLGYFGIIHGVTEWVWMIKLIKVYPQYNIEFLALGIFLNSISFTFLWKFGAGLLEYKGKLSVFINRLPLIVFVLWIIQFAYLYIFNSEFLFQLFFMDDIMSRYFIGLPGSLIAAYALYKNAQTMHTLNLKRIAVKLKGMAVLFLLYGILAGAIVQKKGFFPANILNRQMFMYIFKFPVELGRTITAISITILFIGVIDIFRLETKQKIARLSRQHAASQERRKLGRELHDVIIQNLFAAGLSVENLIDNMDNPNHIESLLSVKYSLNESISQIREFIHKVSSRKIDIEDLNLKVQELVQQFNKNSKDKISYSYKVSDIYTGCLSSEKLTEVYYIIQEALCNAIKHSNATIITITINSSIESIEASITDNGKGFDYSVEVLKENHYGLLSMSERASIVNGLLNIDSSDNGTNVRVSIPWEDCNNEK